MEIINFLLSTLTVLSILLLTPLSSIFLWRLDDKNKNRKKLMNILLLANVLLFFSPIFFALIYTPLGENIFNENSGGGVFLWLYMFIFPISAVIQFFLGFFKIKFSKT